MQHGRVTSRPFSPTNRRGHREVTIPIIIYFRKPVSCNFLKTFFESSVVFLVVMVFLPTGFLPRDSSQRDSSHGIPPTRDSSHMGFLPHGIPPTRDSSHTGFLPHRIPPKGFLPYRIPPTRDSSHRIPPTQDSSHM